MEGRLRTISEADIERAVEELRGGGLVCFPTDTLYALGADACSATAVGRVFDVKGREGAKPLPLFVKDVGMAETIAVLDRAARRLAERFWPGALTLVLEKRPDFESEALVGGNTVALRAPAHPVALAIVGGLARPVTGTSANLSGGPDPATADEVLRQVGDQIDLILDGGPCLVGMPSTIVDCSRAEAHILRRGAINDASIRRTLGA